MNKVTIWLKRNSGTILTIAGSIGFVGSMIFTSKGTIKAQPAFDKDLDNKKRAKIFIKAYAPAAAFGASTLACFIGANILSAKNAANFAAGYALLEQTYRKYRNKTKDIYGSDADEKIIKEIAKDTVNEENVSNEDLGNNELLFYDELSNRHFRTTMEKVLLAEYQVNRQFVSPSDPKKRNRSFVTPNDWYGYLGIPKLPGGDDQYWSPMAGYPWIDFRHEYIENDDGLCFYMIFVDTPFYNEDYDYSMDDDGVCPFDVR